MAHPSSSGNAYLKLLLENANYRNLYIARTISLLGDWLNTLAILVVLTTLSDTSELAFGIVLVIKMLPNAFLSSYAGVIADRYDRKTIMIWADLIRAVIVLGFLLVTIYPSDLFVYLLLAAQTSISTFFEPAKNALVPDIVHREELVFANALSAATWSLMLTTGMLIGGALTELIGWEVVLILDSVTYIISAWFLLKVKTESVISDEFNPKRRPRMALAEIKEAWSYLTERPRVMMLAILKGLYCVGGSASLILAVFGEQVFTVGKTAAPGIALLFTARGIGTALGPILSRRLTQSDTDKMRNIVPACFIGCSIFYMGFAFTYELWLAMLLIVLAHLGSSTIWVFSTVLLQHEVDEQVRGRVFGFELGVFTLTMSLSTLVYSLLLHYELLSPRESVMLLSLMWCLPLLIWLAAERRLSIKPD